MLLLLLASLTQAAPMPPQKPPPSCVRREIIRLAPNTATAEANADAALATCDPELQAFVTQAAERFRTDSRAQMRALATGRPLPDMRPAMAKAMTEATRATAIEATRRLRAGESIEGLTTSAKGQVVTPHNPVP